MHCCSDKLFCYERTNRPTVAEGSCPTHQRDYDRGRDTVLRTLIHHVPAYSGTINRQCRESSLVGGLNFLLAVI